jgi:hypothetical protein
VAPELEDVVGGGQQSPFGSGGRAAAALEALGAAVVLDLAEHGLDSRLAACVELAAVVGGQDAAHEVIKAAASARAGLFAAVGVGCDEGLDALGDERTYPLMLFRAARVPA